MAVATLFVVSISRPASSTETFNQTTTMPAIRHSSGRPWSKRDDSSHGQRQYIGRLSAPFSNTLGSKEERRRYQRENPEPAAWRFRKAACYKDMDMGR
jgi:hypothetical protein